MRHINCSWHQLTYASYVPHGLRFVEFFEIFKFSGSFVLCASCSVLCALCFVLCASCFVLCALCFVLLVKFSQGTSVVTTLM